ncbi:MAG: segregation/condensation protein A [Syntrophobacterales bacterium]|nr:MAG: segregation/condensation protein A [Syntrophobacterales bacterium]
MDIYDIPIATVTDQYLDYLNMMRTLNLDVAGEFLLMASTLLHIKSKMLLPSPPEEEGEEEGEDPRAELVNRLLEYQKYKEGAARLHERDILDRDIFVPGKQAEESEEGGLVEVGVFELIEALKDVLNRSSLEAAYDITLDRITIEERIAQILETLKLEGSGLLFSSLFSGASSKEDIIITFLALLELIKMRMIKIYQRAPFGPIEIFALLGG